MRPPWGDAASTSWGKTQRSERTGRTGSFPVGITERLLARKYMESKSWKTRGSPALQIPGWVKDALIL